ncbi:MAG: hypothetical protein AB7I27_11760 [Bacteriovoracaceae bacterium]
MQHSAIWIDHHKAYIFDYSADGVHERVVEPHQEHKISKEHLKKFYHDLANTLNNSNRILVMGPGMAKMEFKHHCEEHHPTINKAIVAVENMQDHPTKEEILHSSNAFFKKYFMWANA